MRYHVLFVCTGNSVRSILAERLLEHRGKSRFMGYSAGSHPRGDVHPLAIDVLKSHGLPIDGLRSKSWDELIRPDAPHMNLIITVCNQAAGETCPVWPGAPVCAQWDVFDPAAALGSRTQRLAAFHCAFSNLDERIHRLISLSLEDMDIHSLTQALSEELSAGINSRS